MRELIAYSFVLQPTVFIVTCVAGAVIALFRPRIGSAVVFASSFLLYIFATPALSKFLIDELVRMVPTSPDLTGAQAIVVLGGDYKLGDGGKIPDSVGLLTLERLAMAAQLYRRLKLPIAVTGGPEAGSHVPLADLMRDELEQEFSVPVQWVEDRSRTTYENALYTAQLIKPEHIETVILVTQNWHLPRALWSFVGVGLRALPFSMPEPAASIEFHDFLPTASGLHRSFYALHEIIGFAYYRAFY